MMVKSDSTSRLGVEQSGIVRDVIVFIASHFGQRVVSFQNGQSFAEKFQRLALEQLAESSQNSWSVFIHGVWKS